MGSLDAAHGVTRRAPGRWVAEPERGTVFGIRTLGLLARVLGRSFVRVVLYPVALYYAVFGRTAIAASRDWHRRLHGRPARFADVYRHILRFCQVALDRLFLLQGRLELFEIERHGDHHLRELAENRRGAILLGAHLGSFEAMRAMSKDEALRLSVLVHYENARKINDFLAALAPDARAGIIPIDPEDPTFILEVLERVEAGELVAVLGDRVGLGERSVTVPFFGEPAPFPVGPVMLAASLRCPVYLTFGLHTRPNRYDLYCEPLFERVDLPRDRRAEAVMEHVQQYAAALERFARRAPDNWFNFYPFWEER